MDIPGWVEQISTVVLAGATVILALATAYYAYRTKKIEEDRIKNKKKAIRNSIVGELNINNLILSKIREEIEPLKGDTAGTVSIRELPLTEFPETNAYKRSVIDLGMLEEEERDAIMYVYGILKEIKMSYLEIKEKPEIRHRMGLTTPIIEKTIETIAHTKSFIKEFGKGYKLFEGKIPKREKLI